MRQLQALLAASAVAVVLAGCVVQPAVSAPNPYPPPPPLQAEVIPPPHPHWVWEPGHWYWNGRAYAWIGGHYVERPGGTRYVHGEWVMRGGTWVWAPAHWY